ncbi:MAG: DUF6263 family protein [Chitinophagaceae bacterium]
MLKPVWYLPFLLLISSHICGQKVSGNLKLEEGKTYKVTIIVEDTIIQQVGGKAIDFFAKGTAEHFYKPTTVSGQITTLHHQLQRFTFQFDGMNQKKSFDSDVDKEGAFGELSKKTYDVTIDATGKTIKSEPSKIEMITLDESSVIITGMLKDAINVVYPPQKGANSFFKVLPDYEVGIGDTWKDSTITEHEKSVTENTLTAITDSTIIIEFKTTSTSTTLSEMMGRESKTKLNTTTTGKTILDKATGIIKEKTSSSQSNGSKEVMGSTLPMNGKATTVIKVTTQ